MGPARGSLPGVGPDLAAGLLAELPDMSPLAGILDFLTVETKLNQGLGLLG